jgi:hypothetical protein
MEIREIFEDLIKIEPKVMSIESLFNNPDRVERTNYKPSYQRNYVWDDEKATYFIESILLGTEIPPLIYFRNSNKVEVIDGRQRYQTILRFIHNEFKLKKTGLQKLDNIGIANKYFKNIDSKLVELFYDTKLRIIEFSFHTKKAINDELEEIVKQEIFKRYNSGITPLKPTEIDKAAYFEDNLNTFFKLKLQSDKILFRDVSSVLHFEKTNNEIILKKIRQLLVQHQIPIKYYSVKKDTIISKYYEFLFSSITPAEIKVLYSGFIEKINLIKEVKKAVEESEITYNRLISECLFWAFSVLESEKHTLQELNRDIIKDLVEYIITHIDAFQMDRSSFSTELHNRYYITSKFFESRFNIGFDIYLQHNAEFKQRNKEIAPKNSERTSFDELRINKPEPSSIAIVDIARQLERQRFLIRPPYQRNEVINKKKSSSIIESILLGIKLPPIFVFKRADGISEVLDGQQRLLSILGYIQEPYRDENNKIRHSDKDGYALQLKNGILKGLTGKKFVQLTEEYKEKIKNFDLWIIEINQKNNKNFEQIDLFIRLNNKPYPIKEDTFEMWNSYISRNIIDTIKSVHKNNKEWFYFRKNNSRMEDENIYTALTYLQFSVNKKGLEKTYISRDLDVYKVVDKVIFRLKSKNEITKTLEDDTLKEDFLSACNDFEFIFLRKLKELLSENDDDSVETLNTNLDSIFNIENGRRTQQGFYALWCFLFDVSFDEIVRSKNQIRDGLKELFTNMTGIKSRELFDKRVQEFRFRFDTSYKQSNIVLSRRGIAKLKHIGILSTGITQPLNLKTSLQGKSNISYFKKVRFDNFHVSAEEIEIIDESKVEVTEFFDAKPKILIKRNAENHSSNSVALFNDKGIFNNDVYIFVLSRHGISIKYLACILASRFARYRINLNKRLPRHTDLGNITISDIRNIDIPIISFKEQEPFIKILDYILLQGRGDEKSFFFERLLDAMVYELILPKEIKAGGAEILRHMIQLPPLSEGVDENDLKTIEKVYKELSDPKHLISAALLKLLTIEEINIIEGRN